MGTVTAYNLANIAAALGGTYDLGWYAGRTYYRGATPEAIAVPVAMSQFVGLSNVQPLNGAMVDVGVVCDIFLKVGYRPLTGEVFLTQQTNGGDYIAWASAYLTFNPTNYSSISVSVQWIGGDGAVTFGITKNLGTSDPYDYCEFYANHDPSGAQYAAVRINVVANP